VIHVTGTTRDTQRYCHTRCVQPLSFVYRLAILSRSARFTISPLRWIFCYFFPPRPLENERRTRVANFLRSLTSVSLSLCHSLPLPNSLCLFLYFFYFSPPLLLFLWLLREACFASDYYLPRSESTAGLWYTGSMVSRYTPATATPSLRPLGEPMRSPLPPARAPPTASPVLRSPAAVATALSSHHSPIRRTVLCRPSRAASTFCSRGSRDVSTVDLSECHSFYRPTGVPRYLVTTTPLYSRTNGPILNEM